MGWYLNQDIDLRTQEVASVYVYRGESGMSVRLTELQVEELVECLMLQHEREEETQEASAPVLAKPARKASRPVVIEDPPEEDDEPKTLSSLMRKAKVITDEDGVTQG